MTIPAEAAVPDLTAWARRTLSLPEHGSRIEERKLLFRHLAQENFIPSPDWQEALNLLFRRGPAHPPAAHGLWTEEARLRDEVNAFAAGFFAMEPVTRRARWQALEAECRPFPPLAARLRALEPGLGAESACGSDRSPQVNDLARQVTELFVLRPAERTNRRQELFHQLRANAQEWTPAAKGLQKRYPALAALEPQLVDQLTTWGETRKRLQKAWGKAAPAPSSSKASTAGKSVGWGGAVLAFIVLRLLFNLGSHSSRPTSPPSYQVPQFQVQQRTFQNFSNTVPIAPNATAPFTQTAPNSPWSPEGVPNMWRDGPPQIMPGESGFAYQQRVREWAMGGGVTKPPPAGQPASPFFNPSAPGNPSMPWNPSLPQNPSIRGYPTRPSGRALERAIPQQALASAALGNSLLKNRSVQQELKLSDDQIKRIDRTIQSMQAKYVNEAQSLSALDQTAQRRQYSVLFARISTQTRAELAEILGPEQQKRLTQIELQRQGIAAFVNPAVQKPLKLTGEQQTKVKGIYQDAMKETRSLPQGGRGTTNSAALTKIRQQAVARVMDLLTAEQKNEWKQMTGETFELKADSNDPAAPGKIAQNGAASPPVVPSQTRLEPKK
jgi:hypothetical protein